MATLPPLDLRPLKLPTVTSATLGNGFEVLVAERRGLPLVSVRLEIWAGAARDPKGAEGLAEFCGQLLRRGTMHLGKKRTAEQVDSAVEQVGGGLSVDVDHDSTAISISLPSEHVGVALTLARDLAEGPAFQPDEVRKARERHLDELATDLDEPSGIADKATSSLLLGDHPYAHPVEGWLRSVKRFDPKGLRDFHARAYGPAHSMVVVVGDVEAAKVQDLCSRLFSKPWPRAGQAFSAEIGAPAPFAKRQVMIVDKPDATQTQLRLATVGIPRSSPDFFPAAVALGVLGGSFTSRLMQEIRVNRGLSYGASARLHSYRSGGEVVTSTFTKNETAGEAAELALQVTRTFAEQGPTAEELSRFQRYQCGLFPLSLETNEQIGRTLGDMKLYDLGPDHVERFRERVASVTAGEAQAVAKRLLPASEYLLVAVGPAKLLRKQLANMGPSSVVSLKTWA